MRKRGYQDEELIRILQQKAEELGRSPHMCDMKKPSYRTFCNRFGSWADALKVAGLGISTKSKKYSDKELILLLQQKAEELGRTPHVYDMKKPSYRIFCNRFGSWADALKVAGLGISTRSKKYSNEELILILQQKAEEFGRSPHMRDMKKPSYETFRNRFGSWADALKAAGLNTNSRRKYNDKELILILQQKAKELGRTPHVYDMKKPSYRTYCRIFGTWNKALEAAGLKF